MTRRTTGKPQRDKAKLTENTRERLSRTTKIVRGTSTRQGCNHSHSFLAETSSVCFGAAKTLLEVMRRGFTNSTKNYRLLVWCTDVSSSSPFEFQSLWASSRSRPSIFRFRALRIRGSRMIDAPAVPSHEFLEDVATWSCALRHHISPLSFASADMFMLRKERS